MMIKQDNYVKSRVSKTEYLRLHNFIMDSNVNDKVSADHINRDPLDKTIQSINRSKRSDNEGVYYNKGGYWVASWYENQRTPK